MCLFDTPDLPDAPPPPPPAPAPSAKRIFDPVDPGDDAAANAFGLAQLRIPAPKVNV